MILLATLINYMRCLLLLLRVCLLLLYLMDLVGRLGTLTAVEWSLSYLMLLIKYADCRIYDWIAFLMSDPATSEYKFYRIRHFENDSNCSIFPADYHSNAPCGMDFYAAE